MALMSTNRKDSTMQHEITATARDAGRNVVHQVIVDGEVVGTRRSNGRYAYAICEWVAEYDKTGDRWITRTRPDGTVVRRVVVRRWSKNAKATGSTFAVAVRSI
jgi:hypothetical protein